VERDPEWLAELGPSGEGEVSLGDTLGDASLAARQDRLRLAAAALRRLEAYDLSQVEPPLRIAAEALRWVLDDEVRGAPFLLSDYPLNPYDGDPQRLVRLMTDPNRIGSPRDAESYLLRLSGFGSRIEQLLQGLEAREARGVIPPRPSLEKVLSDLRAFLAVPAGENELVTCFRARLDPLGLDAAEIERLTRAARAEVERTVLPAYRELLRHAEGLLPKAPDEVGVWRLPGGDAYYAHRVRHHTTLEIEPAALHRLGLREVERLQGELRAALAALGFEAASTGDALRAYRASMSGGPHLHGTDAAGRASALEDVRARVREARAHFAASFPALPRGEVAVEALPCPGRPGAPAIAYVPASLDGRRAAALRVDLERPLFLPSLQTGVYRAAIPGHHVQMGLQREDERLPTFSRLVSIPAFAEGWAGYAERLALEEGLYTDPHAALWRLEGELLRAARLVVDTGIHHERWWRRDALDWMRETLGHEHEDEVDRSSVLPGAALAGGIGAVRLLELREQARVDLGADFDRVRFHGAVLAHGSLPLAVLEGVLERFVAAGGSER
jgi:uncharacterized protein (DUF885 family)